MTEATEYEFTTNAPKGAERLDTDFPGWADRINLDKLDIRSLVFCVAAQMSSTGFYHDGLRELFPGVRHDGPLQELARRYGFHIDVSDNELYAGPGARFVPMWDALQQDWEHLITARRAA